MDSRTARHRTIRRCRRAARVPRRARSRCDRAPARCRVSRPNRRKIPGLTDVSCRPRPAPRSAGQICPAFAHAHSLLCFARGALQRPCRSRGSQVWRRLCAVKVKLTIALGTGAGLASVRPLQGFAGFLKDAREVDTQAASNSLVIARGGVGMPPGPGASKISTDEGGLSQSPPFVVFIDVFTIF